MPTSIRRATVADAATLARLNAAVQEIHARAHPEVFMPVDLPAATAAFEKWVADPNWHMLIVADDLGVAVGYVGAHLISYPANPFMHAAGYVRLDQMAVLPEHEGRGFGRALVEAVFDLARTLGVGEVQLNVWDFNDRARLLYERMGFSTFRHEMRAPVPPQSDG